ncbi:hypothetical protein, partial [Cellulosimicrobium sp. CUA-896]|uniref:hypothetical protein n=1 Tax=Cellulosimicrobium sp. CUA-896 TaxID=1517881 RepID=UPI0013013A8F
AAACSSTARLAVRPAARGLLALDDVGDAVRLDHGAQRVEAVRPLPRGVEQRSERGPRRALRRLGGGRRLARLAQLGSASASAAWAVA